MAITINGTGTITGISAGGLPDGSVTEADLASSLDLSSKTVTLPSGTGGKILQHQYVIYEATTQLTSAGAFHELTTSLRIAFTPVSDNSTLILRASGTFCCPNSGNIAYAAFYNVTDSAYVDVPVASSNRQRAHWGKRTTPHDPNDMDYMDFEHIISNTSTTARTYTIYHFTESVTQQFLVSNLSTGGGFIAPLRFSITEVAN
jgi:hypothetical protein